MNKAELSWVEIKKGETNQGRAFWFSELCQEDKNLDKPDFLVLSNLCTTTGCNTQ